MAGNNPLLVTPEDILAQTEYLNTQTIANDFRYEFGFRFKKVMFAFRKGNTLEGTWAIYVTFSRHTFNCPEWANKEAVENSNFVKVGPIVIPRLVLGQQYIQQIEDYCQEKGIFGIFYDTVRMRLLTRPNTYFEGKLYVIFRYAFNNLGTQVGVISAVYPYYEYRNNEYHVYLQFDEREDKHYFQTRLTPDEMVNGIHTMRIGMARNKIETKHCFGLYTNPNYRYAAIYVSRFTTLAVVFENNVIDHYYDNERTNFANKQRVHERVLFQCGGLVGLQEYELCFQFMNDPNGQRYENLEKLMQSNKIQIEDNSDVANMRSPLIVLGSTGNLFNLDKFDEKGEKREHRPHFASYGLDIENLRVPKRATLLLPTGARFITVQEFTPIYHDYHDGHSVSKGLNHLFTLWNAEPYKAVTGKYSDADPNGINGLNRSQFPYM